MKYDAAMVAFTTHLKDVLQSFASDVTVAWNGSTEDQSFARYTAYLKEVPPLEAQESIRALMEQHLFTILGGHQNSWFNHQWDVTTAISGKWVSVEVVWAPF